MFVTSQFLDPKKVVYLANQLVVSRLRTNPRDPAPWGPDRVAWSRVTHSLRPTGQDENIILPCRDPVRVLLFSYIICK